MCSKISFTHSKKSDNCIFLISERKSTRNCSLQDRSSTIWGNSIIPSTIPWIKEWIFGYQRSSINEKDSWIDSLSFSVVLVCSLYSARIQTTPSAVFSDRICASIAETFGNMVFLENDSGVVFRHDGPGITLSGISGSAIFPAFLSPESLLAQNDSPIDSK